MRVVLVTRGDLFPTNHGAAARIVSFAEHLSQRGDEVLLVSEDRDVYHRWRAGLVSRVPYSPKARAAQDRHRPFVDSLAQQANPPGQAGGRQGQRRSQARHQESRCKDRGA